MKFNSLILTAGIMLFVASGALAQNKNVRKAKSALESGNLEEARDEINPATKDDKTGDKAETWFIKGRTYFLLSQRDSLNAQGEALRDTAYEAFKKTLELDEKYKEMVLAGYQPLSNLYVSYWKYGAEGFNNKDYEAAYDGFEKVDEVNKYMYDLGVGMGTEMDTMAVLNMGNAAFNWGKKDTAIENYQKLADIDYDEQDFIYRVLLQEYKDDPKKFLATVEKAKKLFPNNKDFAKEEVNYYIANGETEKLIKKLEEVVANDPTDYDAVLNLAISYGDLADPKSVNPDAEVPENQQELFDKSVETYKKALEINPDGYAANFNLGLMYYNTAANLGSQINKLSDEDKKAGKEEELANRQDEYLDESFPYIKKAYDILDAKPSLDPSELASYKNAIRGLQGVYARQDDMDKYQEMKDKLDEADSKAQE